MAENAPPPYPGGQPQPYPTDMKQGAYPPQPGYAPQQPGYPPQQPGYPPQQPGYPPPQAGYPPPPPPGTTTTIIQQPGAVIVTPVIFGEHPVSMHCPSCKANIITGTDFVTGTLTWLACVGLCVVGLVQIDSYYGQIVSIFA